MPTRPSRDHIAAVVVLFEPSAEHIEHVLAYIDQVAKVIAVDNTPEPHALAVERLTELGVEVVSMGSNIGIAAALNAGCGVAMAYGFEWALTLDQDSTPAPDMVHRLTQCLCEDDSDDVFLAVPVWQIEGGVKEQLSPRCIELDVAMTSGNLVRLAAWKALGGFREGFFIDAVDTEYCLRGRQQGMRILQRRDAVLIHRPGSLERKRFPTEHFVSNYSPLRRYYMTRNTLEVLRAYGHQYPAWASRERHQLLIDTLKIALSERNKVLKLHRMLQGARDYRRGRFGRYEDLHGGDC
ncbi:MAG: glycosyltransferase family 2 protein [Coriobacteriia bacterium]